MSDFWWIVALLFTTTTVHSQDCSISYENGDPINPPFFINPSVNETAPVGTNIITLLTSPGSLVCTNSVEDGLFLKYIKYENNETILEFTLGISIGDDYDNNLEGLAGNAGEISGFCTLSCNNGGEASVNPIVQIIEENNQAPEFSPVSEASIVLDQNTPPGLDFSSLLVPGGIELLTVYDKDLQIDPSNPFATIKFSVDNDLFQTLPPIEMKSTDSTGKERTTYVPRLAVTQRLNPTDSPIIFNLIATDQGTPPQETQFQITVKVKSYDDLRDPAFNEDYYTSKIESLDFTGQLIIDQSNIIATDPDNVTGEFLEYSIKNSDGLDLSLDIDPDSGEVNVVLNTPVGELDKLLAYVVIEARQGVNKDRASTVVLVIQLPVPDVTSSQTTDCPVVSTVITTECLTTECPETESPTSCPTCQDCSTTTALTCPPTDCPSSLSTDGSSNTSESCPTCPDVCSTEITSPCNCPSTDISSSLAPCTTCPDVCSTEVTCPSPNNCPTSDNNISPGSCPTCPDVCFTSDSSCPICPSNVTCPSSSTAAPDGPLVIFELQQYASELVDNLPIGTPVVEVKATSTDGQIPEYSLKYGILFRIDPATGSVTLATSLAAGIYEDDAIATIPSGQSGTTKILVNVVSGIYCDTVGAQFSSSVFDAVMDERTTGSILSVLLINGSDYTMSITWSDPDFMQDYFSVRNGGEVFVDRSFDRSLSGPRILLKIEAEPPSSSRQNSNISTVVDIRVMDINDPPAFNYLPSPFLIGYPSRTFFDPAVSMPLFVFQASDPDDEENAILSYHLSPSDIFDIDSSSGFLSMIGVDSLDPKSNYDFTVTVQDLPGLTANLNVLLRALEEDYITQISAQGSEYLSDELISTDLSRILGYRVMILHKEKTASNKELNFGYALSLYAVNTSYNVFVSRTDFEKKMSENSNALNDLNWTILLNSVMAPSAYAPSDLIQQKEALTISTAVLAGLLGLVLILIVCFVVYKKKSRKANAAYNGEIKRKDSLTITKKNMAEQRYADPAPLNHNNSEIPSAVNKDLTLNIPTVYLTPDEPERRTSRSSLVRFSPEEPKIIENKFVEEEEEEIYCPPSPGPQKGILKDPFSSSEKQTTNTTSEAETAGVKFNETPEVIQVAATSSTDDADDDLDENGDDDNNNKDTLMVAM